MKTIAELEAASNAADAARDIASLRLEALKEVHRALNAAGMCHKTQGLDAGDRDTLMGVNALGIMFEMNARRAAAAAELERLEAESLDAQRALNDAPEEAA